MNILAITKHKDLNDRLRTAFEGSGHRVFHVKDQMEALASEAWNRAQLILVDAEGDPMDGFRFCALLRGESRILFQNLPIFLIFDTPLEEEGQRELREADVDGYVLANDSLGRLVSTLRAAVEVDSYRGSGPKVPVMISGIAPPVFSELQSFMEHFGFQFTAASLENILETQKELRAPLVLLGLDEALGGNPHPKEASLSAQKTLEVIHALWEEEAVPYVMILANESNPALQRKLLVSGVMDWIPLPLSPPHLLHACRRGLDWLQARRIQREFHFQVSDLRERRLLLEIEASALRNEVLTDPLTGLLNRRAFNQNLENAFNQWERHGRPFLLILGDLDYFKLINDRFGHIAGDEVLRALADRMRTGLRRSDLAFRVGGEEFAIILMETSLQVGAEVAEKLRRRIEEVPFRIPTGQTIFPTISLGVGGPEGQTLDSIYPAVDQALYRAKNKGRNRIEVMRVEE